MHGLTEHDAMVSAKGIVPWHQHPNARVLADETLTAGEAIRAANLDWEVEKWPAYIRDGEGGSVVPTHDYYWVVRRDLADAGDLANAVLGCVRGSYRPVQNRTLFRFTDALLAHGGAHYDTAGSLFGGRRVWVLAEFPDATIEQVAGLDDPHKAYCLVWNTHDGSAALSASVVWVRVVCNNTLRAALRGQVTEWRLRHTESIKEALEDARQALGIVVRATEGYKYLLDDLAQSSFDDNQFEELLNRLRPARLRDSEDEEPGRLSSRMAVERAELWTLWREGTTVNQGGLAKTRYAALNAVTEWADHQRGRPKWRAQNPDKYLNRVLWGSSNDLKQQALIALTEIS